MQNECLLPDGSAFCIASLPLPKDHWLYAPQTSEWDEVRDVSSNTPFPCVSNSPEQRELVAAAIRYAIRGATECGTSEDFDPDAIVQNAVFALCGPVP